MAPWLNKTILCLILFLCTVSVSAQEPSVTPEYKDYKNKDQFETFSKRRKKIAAWQIQQLKQGALVVRLKTNKRLIDALLAKGETELAQLKAAEQFVINKHTMMAYLRHIKFCKVYFIYSNSSDSLLNNIRQGIFLDTNLRINPDIRLTETFYLLAERDMAFNSSIGFVKEDSAKYVSEHGNPIKEMGLVLKNKYGHQLKAPMPYYEQVKTYNIARVPGLCLFRSDGTYLWFAKSEGYTKSMLQSMYPDTQKIVELDIRKPFMPEKLALMVAMFNEKLFRFYKKAYSPIDYTKDADVAPFLY